MSNIPALPAELTIYNVSELHPLWLEWLHSHESDGLVLEANGVSEVDAAGVQLLLALRNALRKQRRTLKFLRPSENLRQACRALGTDLLAEPAEEPCA